MRKRVALFAGVLAVVLSSCAPGLASNPNRFSCPWFVLDCDMPGDNGPTR